MQNTGDYFKRITLERTACFGSCPVYSLDIQSDGKVKFHGKHFVEAIGDHTWQLDQKAMASINKAIRFYDYFNIKEQEITYIQSCQPSCITSVLLEDGTYRKIIHEYGNDKYPEKLEKFENRIDKIINVQQYIGKQDF